MVATQGGAAVKYTGARIYGTSDNASYNLMSTGYVWFENTNYQGWNDC